MLVQAQRLGWERLDKSCRERGGLAFADRQSRAPLVSKNVQADAAVGVDVGVVDASGEVHLRGLEGVVCREVDGQEEDTTRVRGVTLQGSESAIISESVRLPLRHSRAGDRSVGA